MTLYKYLAKTTEGQTVEGSVEGQNEGDVINELRTKGLLIVEVKKAKAAKMTRSHKKISLDNLVTFTRQMATMIDAGLPLLQAIRIMSEQMDNINFRLILVDIADNIEGGASFSEALARHPKAFDTLYCAMIKVGEASGMFAEILVKVATYMEESAKLKRKVKTAMIYPSVVSFMALLITSALLIWVVPIFSEIYEGFGGELPAPTQFIVMLSDIMRKYILLVLIIVIACVFITKSLYKTSGGRMFFDRLTFKIPVFGQIFQRAAFSRFTKTLGTLIASGVPMIQSMEIVYSVVGNATLEAAIDSTSKKIMAGEGLSGPLAESKIFPPMVIRMIDVGEKTGKLDLMLEKIAEYYDDLVQNAVASLTSLIEPLLIAFLGIVVGGIVICMFLPILKLSEMVS